MQIKLGDCNWDRVCSSSCCTSEGLKVELKSAKMIQRSGTASLKRKVVTFGPSSLGRRLDKMGHDLSAQNYSWYGQSGKGKLLPPPSRNNRTKGHPVKLYAGKSRQKEIFITQRVNHL